MPKYYENNTKRCKINTPENSLQNPNDRRGLINAIGMISKILFGTMDIDMHRL